MKCPYCNHPDTRVIDSRPAEDGSAIRRRRSCDECGKRFTTYEKVETIPLIIIKKDNNREQYNRSKIERGIIRACYKRPVSAEAIQKTVERIEIKIFNLEANQEISKERIYAAALLHDIGRHIQYENGTPHQIAGLPIAEQILTDCGFYSEEMKEILYAIENHRNKEMLKRNDLAGILYRADKMSRCCFGCRAEKECNWSTEKKNMEIQY